MRWCLVQQRTLAIQSLQDSLCLVHLSSGEHVPLNSVECASIAQCFRVS